ncbi:MAG: cysteate synthase [Bacteroidetes bacterium]|nr:cysteate synthase [Bacteroidota bacterium]
MTEQRKSSGYVLQSFHTKAIFNDSGWLLEAPGESVPALIRAVYEKQRLDVGDDSCGIYRFQDWLPIHTALMGSSAPVTYKSAGLAGMLRLENLYITFSGFWPEKGAFMKTCSFKETEAYTVCARLDQNPGKVLVVASAGNTARAFARVCSDNKIPLLLCVPMDNLDALWFDGPLDPCVKLIASQKGGDYFDAIHLSNIAATINGFVAEGGAKNVARRDGMGTTVLSATTTIGMIPHLYFQAVGSGTGAIAAWEANLRFLQDGRYGDHKMKLMLSQNAPFLPMYEAWKAGSRALLPYNDGLARKHVEIIDAKVLSNRKPPYSIAGGLFDALVDAGGDILPVTNEEARLAAGQFLELEGIDIHPAAAVATASLMREVSEGKINREAIIMLNITGGGEIRFKEGRNLYYLKPDLVFPINPSEESVRMEIGKLTW